MPRRELSPPKQIVDWLEEWGKALAEPASMILIGSAALRWHAADRGLDTPLPENSMDVDLVTDSDALARARAEGSSLRAVVREIPRSSERF